MASHSSPDPFDAFTEDELAGLLAAGEGECVLELERLDAAIETLQHRVCTIEAAKLTEELTCFRDVLALHRALRRARRR